MIFLHHLGMLHGMTAALHLSEQPSADEIYMLAGWRQWADAGAASSGPIKWLIQHLDARKIGEICPDGFFLFQTPVSQSLFRPVIKLEDGCRRELLKPRSEIFYWSNVHKGLVLFLGDEPHLAVDYYAKAFFDIAHRLHVKRIVALGGVYDTVPYDKDRAIFGSYSLPPLKAELDKYAVHPFNYEGGATIGAYLGDQAESLGVEYLYWQALVPVYPLSQLHSSLDDVAVQTDVKAWFDILLRLNYMFGLDIDLSELETGGATLTHALRTHIEAIDARSTHMPILPSEYIARLTAKFAETPFNPQGGDIWEDALSDIFKGTD